MSGSKIICMTGPESSGKSTLAAAVAQMLDAPLVPELARQMLAPGQRYDAADVERIGLAQAAFESRVLKQESEWVVLDTDLLVIRIWMHERFGGWPYALEALYQDMPPRLYVLCAPDMAWEDDPLRENPEDRWRLFKIYREELSELERRKLISVLTVEGDHEQRMATVRSGLGLEPT